MRSRMRYTALPAMGLVPEGKEETIATRIAALVDDAGAVQVNGDAGGTRLHVLIVDDGAADGAVVVGTVSRGRAIDVERVAGPGAIRPAAAIEGRAGGVRRCA